MKTNLLLIAAFSVMLLSCKEKDPYGGRISKFTYAFESRNSEINMTEDSEVVLVSLNRNTFQGQGSAEVFVDDKKSSAIENVHYKLPAEFEFIFTEKEETKSNITITVFPKNITKTETLTFYIPKIGDKDPMYIDTTTLTLIPPIRN